MHTKLKSRSYYLYRPTGKRSYNCIIYFEHFKTIPRVRGVDLYDPVDDHYIGHWDAPNIPHFVKDAMVAWLKKNEIPWVTSHRP